jgi:hypothetical protein
MSAKNTIALPSNLSPLNNRRFLPSGWLDQMPIALTKVLHLSVLNEKQKTWLMHLALKGAIEIVVRRRHFIADPLE